MYAFGDGLVFIAVFSTVALVRPAWRSISCDRTAGSGSALDDGSAYRRYGRIGRIGLHLGILFGTPRFSFGVLRGSGGSANARSTLAGGSLLLSGFIAPDRTSRWVLLAAAGIEVWWLPAPFTTGSSGAGSSDRHVRRSCSACHAQDISSQ